MAVLLSTAASSTTYSLNLKLHGNNCSVIREKPLQFLAGWSGTNNSRGDCSVFLSSAVKSRSAVETTDWVNGKITRRKGKKPVLSEGRDEDEELGPICPGCGIFMQDKDPNSPGFYIQKKVVETEPEEGDQEYIEDELDEFGLDEEEDGSDDGIEGALGEDGEDDGDLGDEFDWESDEWEAKFVKNDDESELDGFAPAGVGFGNVTEEIIEKQKKKSLSKSEKKKLAREEAKKEKDNVTVCARCHSLRNYGHVKNQAAENLIPDFDFDRLIATRLMKPVSNAGATVVVMVVDCVDFDGSFPKRAAKSLFKALERAQTDTKLSAKLPKLVLVATKVDLLPTQVSPARLDRWVRHRAKAGGAPKLSSVYLVSARKDLGVKNLLACIKELAGPRGNVWVIGAQNAGKSTLINAFCKKEGAKVSKLTEAPVPGTTLGILRIRGILSAKAKMYDTPGLLHPNLMSMRLNREEQKMIEIRKELQPRTYRVKVGQSVHVGGLVRLGLDRATNETIYITVWASQSISLHLGKIENAEEILKSHVGIRLQPPVSQDRVNELGDWEEKEIQVSGNSWDVNSIDLSLAGLGWFSLGLKGEATLSLWTYPGIEITLREPLVLDRAAFLERPGFWLPKAISEALGNQIKPKAPRKKKQQEAQDFLSEVSA